MIRIPPLKTRDIMNSRLRGSIGLSTSPATGSNVHRSSPLTFGKLIFICGRPVSAAFFRRPVWEQTIGKQSNERPFQKHPAVPDASGKTFRKSLRSSINLLQLSPGVRCAVMQTLGIPRIRITAPLSLQRISSAQHPPRSGDCKMTVGGIFVGPFGPQKHHATDLAYRLLRR